MKLVANHPRINFAKRVGLAAHVLTSAAAYLYVRWHNHNSSAQTETVARDMRFLNNWNEAFLASLDFGETLENVASSCLDGLAEWCLLQVENQTLVRHRDESKLAIAQQLAKSDLRLVCADKLHSRQLYDAEDVQGLFEGMSRKLAEKVWSLGSTRHMCLPLVARGKRFGCISLFYGKHDEMRSESERMRVAKDLSVFAALAIDNARLYRESLAATTARQEFISIASHELKTPLTSILGYLQLISKTENLKNQSLLEKAEKQCRRAVTFTENLLNASKLAAGKLPLDPENMDLRESAREVVQRLLTSSEHESHTPITLNAPEPIWGVWDRMRIEQILTNLISNAIKYGQRKPVTVTIEGSPELARIIVRDQGIGMSREAQNVIFNRFERAVPAKFFKGTGLGLWIVREIVEGHKGRIKIKSELGQGSTFTVELPRAKAPAKTSMTSAA